MVKFSCKSHNVSLIIEGNRRRFQNPPGGFMRMPKCYLHLEPHPTEGKHGECEIVKEEK